MVDYVYDIESLPNVFTCVSLNTDTREIQKFEVSPRRNDIVKFRKWINLMAARGDRMFGFNNQFYDYPVVHFIMTEALSYEGSKSLTRAIKKRSDAIIGSGNLPGLGRFKYTIWEYKQLVQQVDLFKIYHFDNKAKATSLKRLQFNMRLDNIQEFELPFDKPVKKSSDIIGLMDYNVFDAYSTDEFRKMTESQIQFREDMSDKLNKNAMNYNDTKLGEEYMKMQLRNRVGDHILEDEDGKRRGTKRGVIPVKDLIFDNIQFDHPEFKKVLSFMQTLNMHIVKGKFRWNERDDYIEGLKKVDKQDQFVKQIRKASRNEKDKEKKEEFKNLLKVEKQKLDDLNEKYANHEITCEIDGFEFDFGKGGLHGARKNSVYRSNSEYVILDVDVTSFYPSIGIEYNLYPEHLTEAFCPIYAEQKTMRLSYAKGTVENAMLKLALNGAYGKTGSEHSVFYDPKYTVTTTINGQLMLCMLWEKLRELKFIEIIQANTDGITFYIRRDLVKKAGAICRSWQKTTKMKLEQVVYSQMFTRDVNNYVCEYKGGGVKAKGAYVFESLYHEKGMSTKNIEWHKNHSSLVVQKAAQAYMLKGTSISKFITEHEDIYDFFLCTNLNRTSKLLLEFNEEGMTTRDEEHQRNSRYIISNSGGKLIKLMPPLPKEPTKWRRIGINTNYVASIYNRVENDNAQDYDINFQFYIDEAEKLVAPFVGKL